MENLSTDWFMVVILLPVLAGIFKTEIGNLFKAWNAYRLRAFDADGNPATSDQIQIMNGATGIWVDALITYKFSFSTKKRGVYITYTNGAKEKVNFLTWAGFRKRNPPVGYSLKR